MSEISDNQIEFYSKADQIKASVIKFRNEFGKNKHLPERLKKKAISMINKHQLSDLEAANLFSIHRSTIRNWDTLSKINGKKKREKKNTRRVNPTEESNKINEELTLIDRKVLIPSYIKYKIGQYMFNNKLKGNEAANLFSISRSSCSRSISFYHEHKNKPTHKLRQPSLFEVRKDIEDKQEDESILKKIEEIIMQRTYEVNKIRPVLNQIFEDTDSKFIEIIKQLRQKIRGYAI